MKKYCFEIVVSAAFLFSALEGMAQTADKPVLERHSSSSSSQKMKDMPTPELKKNSASVSMNKSTADSLQQLNPPQLKKADYSSGQKEKINTPK